MPDTATHLNPALVLAHAKAWVGTPFIEQGGLRGAGADCIGLVRGVYRELTGIHIAAPPWRRDYPTQKREHILERLRCHAIPIPHKLAQPGHVVTYRIGDKRGAHVGIMSDRGAIHAWEHAGVADTLHPRPEITSAWALPAAPECESGPTSLTAEDCLAVIYPHQRGPFAQITLMRDGTPLARTCHYQDTCAALAALDPIYPIIETME